jgi:hypothetical protein
VAEQSRRKWWMPGVLFGILVGVLWVPVQLTQPPAPDLPGSLLVGAIMAGIFAVVFGRLVPFPLRRTPGPWSVAVLVTMTMFIWGGLTLAVTGDAGLAVRIVVPRTLYVLVLGILVLWLIRRERAQ